jgi:ubiquinone/menaquinone biosynthesis C-methylase UbiE
MNELQDQQRYAELKEREYEDQVAHRYNNDYHCPPIMAAHSKSFVEFVAEHVRPGDRILDLGCASASLWPLFKKLLPSDISLVGVDLSPKMLEEARVDFPTGDFREGSFLDIPSRNGEFDIVIVSSAFHHINDALLPNSLKEVSRVLDEHGLLIGREPLASNRLGDRGGWIAGALMALRHLSYRVTGTREFPEPDPGPDHHAYDPKDFLEIINKTLAVVDVQFRNPASLFLARIRHPLIVAIAQHLDSLIKHREGQEVHYAARKNFANADDVKTCIKRALEENHLSEGEIHEFLAHVSAAAQIIEQTVLSKETKWKP